jgi:CRP/FNR family transcriptional regulator, cyclic AMP receptor protein
MLYAVRDGFARVDSISNNGTEQLVWVATRYDIIPTERLFRRHADLNFYYSALTDMTAYEIPKEKFLEMCNKDIGFITEVAQSMSAHYDDLLSRLQSVEQSNVRDKLIHTLYDLATRFGAGGSIKLHEIGLQLSHQDIARMIGATRETTAIELKRLKDDGLIDYTRSEFTIETTKLGELI